MSKLSQTLPVQAESAAAYSNRVWQSQIGHVPNLSEDVLLQFRAESAHVFESFRNCIVIVFNKEL